MKELSTEEKAKRYDEVLETAKKIHSGEGVPAPPNMSVLEVIFPELKELEDERISKHLLYHFRNKTKEEWNGMPVKDIIAYLEKQGEHKKFRDSIQVGDKVTKNEDGVLVNLSQLKRVAKKDEQILANSAKTCKDEQKPAWSKEDDNCLSTIIAEFSKCAGKSVSKDEWMRCNDFLNSLKDRVQPKQEWNDKEKRALNGAIVALSMYANGNIPNILPSQLLEDVEQLKSLNPQSQWKPTEEHLKGLRRGIKNTKEGSDAWRDLKDLYEQLKAL